MYFKDGGEYTLHVMYMGMCQNLDILMDLRATNSGTTGVCYGYHDNGKTRISVHKDPNHGYTCIPHSHYIWKVYTLFWGELIFININGSNPGANSGYINIWGANNGYNPGAPAIVPHRPPARQL